MPGCTLAGHREDEYQLGCVRGILACDRACDERTIRRELRLERGCSVARVTQLCGADDAVTSHDKCCYGSDR